VYFSTKPTFFAIFKGFFGDRGFRKTLFLTGYKRENMEKRITYHKNLLTGLLGFLALFCAVFAGSCDLPGGPGFGTGTLTLLPQSTAQGSAAPAYKNSAGVSRSVISDSDRALLTYRLTVTGPGGTQTLDTGGAGATVTLEAGEWTVVATAYDSANTLVGSGSAAVTVAAGRNSFAGIPMTVDPAYEATLTAIYIHNEADLRRVAVGDFAINGAIDFYLERDIVLTQPWKPIGNSGSRFKADFDGKGHSITINSFSAAALSGDYLGLFGYTDGADIKDLTIVYSNLTGIATTTYSQHSVGGLAGRVENTTTIANVHVKGAIAYTYTGSGNNLYIGGLVGEEIGPLISNSSFTGTLTGVGGTGVTVRAGGIAGYSGSTINASYAAGTINVTTDDLLFVGGIAGEGNSTTIDHCYSAVTVTGTETGTQPAYAGGIIGRLGSSTGFVFECYALGPVTVAGTSIRVGGIAGQTVSSTIENCAALADVTGIGSTTVGRVIGDNAGTSTNNYAAFDTTITRGSSGGTVEDGDTTYALSDFQGSGNQSKYVNDLGWTFGAMGWWDWLPGYDYPVLFWQTSSLPPPV
jgi:hypothetical protein